MHGNEPSRGAKIDAELQQEEEEEPRRKGKLNWGLVLRNLVDSI